MNYWNNREIRAREKLLDAAIDNLNYQVKQAYVEMSKSLIEDLINTYNKIMAEGDQALASHRYSYNRQYEMLAQIQEKLHSLGVKEEELFTKDLTNLYKHNYELVGKNVNFITKIDEEKVKNVVLDYWAADGKNFSDRIWTNKSALTDKLSKTLANAVATGASTDRVTKQLMEDFSVSYRQANRLARTEMAHIQIQSTIDKYKEAGIEQYRVLSEAGCCEKCADLNDKIFRIEDTEHLPPLHPHCRCSVLAVLE